jgi:hypothetical protein
MYCLVFREYFLNFYFSAFQTLKNIGICVWEEARAFLPLSEAIVIKQFQPKEGAREGAEKVLKHSCSIELPHFL